MIFDKKLPRDALKVSQIFVKMMGERASYTIVDIKREGNPADKLGHIICQRRIRA